jgi:hypothetical protein
LDGIHLLCANYSSAQIIFIFFNTSQFNKKTAIRGSFSHKNKDFMSRILCKSSFASAGENYIGVASFMSTPERVENSPAKGGAVFLKNQAFKA